MPPVKKFRTRRWSCVAYGVNPECLEMLKFTPCVGLAMIKHDKDVKEDGTPKEEHWHILCYFDNAVSLRGVQATIDNMAVGNVFAEPVKDARAAYEYLIHKNDKNKQQYDANDIITWGEFEKLQADDSKEQANEHFLIDLLTMSRYELACKYGRDYIRNYDAYRKFAEMLKEDMEVEEYVED